MTIRYNQNAPVMLGVKETSEIRNLSMNYVRQLALCGAIKSTRTGKSGRGKILINLQSLDDYLNSSYLNDGDPAPAGSLKPISVKL